MNNINNTAQDQALRNNLNPSEYDKGTSINQKRDIYRLDGGDFS